MNIVCIGGGPAGLYFGILMKRADPSHTVTVIERNRPDDTFGFGVVFSDATLGNLAEADPESYREIERHFAHWDDIDIHFRGQVFRSSGHGFCGMGRQQLLHILQERAAALGVQLQFEREIESLNDIAGANLIVAADGVSSAIRDQMGHDFQPHIDLRPNKFVWLGTTVPFKAFTFYFRETEHGLFRVHAYRYAEGKSTFIVECTEATWRKAGLDKTDEDGTIAYLEAAFAEDLGEHRLIKNRSIWRNFPTISNGRWSHENVVLVGDAAHTAHFSIGSGTKLAMEDCIALRDAVVAHPDVPTALAEYERRRRPAVDALQQTAQVSLEWFENTERYQEFPPIQFAFSLLTRSLRVTHRNLLRRDKDLVAAVDTWFARRAGADVAPGKPVPTPMFTPFRLRDVELVNRVVMSAWPLGDAKDGVPGSGHLVFLGARAQGGVGLVVSEHAAVAADGVRGGAGVGLFNDAQAAAWSNVVAHVHQSSRAKIAATLSHHGGNADRLSSLAEDFVMAAKRAQGAGFDLIWLELAAGTTIGRVLAHSGGVLGRTGDIVRAVRDAYDGPIAVRLSVWDRRAHGLTPAEGLALAATLADLGVDLIAVTTGENRGDAPAERTRLFQAPFADRVRNEVGISTVAEGGIISSDDVDSTLAAGRADLCALGRALAFDPAFVNRAAQARGLEVDYGAAFASLKDFVPRS